MSRIEVRLFGRPVISREEGEQPVIGGLKAQELFCLLLLRGGRAQPRDHLAGILWADAPAGRARQYLRKALWRLQIAFSATATSAAKPVMLAGPDAVAINRLADLWVDAASFEDTLAATKGVAGRQLTPALADALATSVTLYRGELLEGWLQDWCLVERERFEVMYLTALDKLMSYCESHREYERGIEYGLAVLGKDPAREYTHRALMRLYYQMGDRTGALRQFQRCASALQEELQVRPSPRTVALFERIRATAAEDAEETFAIGPPDAGATANGLGGLALSLHRIEDAIHDVRMQLTQHTDASDTAEQR